MRIHCRYSDILSNSAASNIDISSIINTFSSRSLVATCGNLYRTFLNRSSADSIANPIPKNECNVLPPSKNAAVPVEAVIPNLNLLSTQYSFILLRVTDLPVPAGPVKNIFLPSLKCFNADCCS